MYSGKEYLTTRWVGPHMKLVLRKKREELPTPSPTPSREGEDVLTTRWEGFKLKIIIGNKHHDLPPVVMAPVGTPAINSGSEREYSDSDNQAAYERLGKKVDDLWASKRPQRKTRKSN